MILTRAEMNLRDPSAIQALRDCCDMHRNIMRLFALHAGQEPRWNAEILYRVIKSYYGMTLYIYSMETPDLRKAAWLRFGENASSRNLSELFGVMTPGWQAGFDLLACPSKKIRREGTNSARIFLRTPEERTVWLRRQGEKYGFLIRSVHEISETQVCGKKETGRIRLHAVHFSGLLEVTDVKTFQAAYARGIGPEKAYGLGMLLLTGR